MSDKSNTKETPSKQLDFSTSDDNNTVPLSSIKMALIKKSTPTSMRNSSLPCKSSIKSKVKISSGEPDIRCYERTPLPR